MTKPYVQSNFPRKPDDDYQTVDPRCVHALTGSIHLFGNIVDCCSPNGSGIVSELVSLGYDASGVENAFSNFYCDWVVSNPPYKRGLVDEIIWEQIHKLREHKVVAGVVMLLRNNFSFAKSRWDMFANNPNYFGEIQMLFRPWWSDSKDKQPIHNFVWHIWTGVPNKQPIIKFWRPK